MPARLCRLLPKGRKSVGEGFGEWSEAPSYEEGVLGQAKRAKLERGLMEERRVKPCKKGSLKGFALQNSFLTKILFYEKRI